MTHKFDPDVYQKSVDAKAEIALSDLANKTYQQVQDYVENQVTDLTSAKVVTKKMAVVMLAILKQQDLGT